MPRQQQPDQIRRSYYEALLPIVHSITKAAFDPGEVVSLLRQERAEADAAAELLARTQAHLRPDVDRKARALELVRKAGERAAAAFRPTEVEDVAKTFGKRTSVWQKNQIERQTRAAFGVELNQIEPGVTAKLEGFAAENVSLIKDISQRYFDRLKADVMEAFDSGMRPETLADRLIERDGMAERDAIRIARDQIGKLNGELNQERQEQMGVTGYIWRTAKDNRVRDNHGDLDGEHFEWSDPPMGGGTSADEEGHPGSGIQCRCYAEPDLAPLLGGDES